jgi:hypothetical protein
MIYLASPYTHTDPGVREERFDAACRAAATLIRAGHHVFSPVAHSHPIARYGLPLDWQFWESFDRRVLEMCDEVVVLTLPGWEDSVGVRAEIQLARDLGKLVAAHSPDVGQKCKRRRA